MSGPRLTAAEGRALDQMVEANTRAKQITWAKATLARCPFRSDLRGLIADLEAKGAKSRREQVRA